MIPLGENLCPGRPINQFSIEDHLVSLMGVGDQLGGVAAEEHHHYGGEEGGHCVVSSVVAGYGVMVDCGSSIQYVALWLFSFDLTYALLYI